MMTADTRAAVFTGPNQPFELRRLPVPVPREAELLVRVTCCTLCGSDLHTYSGRRAGPVPAVLGHEILGRVERFGATAPRRDLLGQTLREGDRVTWTLAASCGDCFYCTHALPQKCERLFKYGHEPFDTTHALSGGLADYCLLAPGTGIVRLPDTLPDCVACPVNCATATVAAALRTAGGCAEQAVLVQGAGMLGLTACALARQAGAVAVVCTEIRADRLAQATRFGATHAVPAGGGELRDTVHEVTAGRGVDLALELTGAAAAHEAGLPLLRIGGRYVWVGAVAPTGPVAVNPETLVRRLLTIHGVHNYTPADLVTAVQFLTEHAAAWPFAELVSHSYRLEEVDEAFRQATATSAVRVAVVP